jgi:hypothetical protein
MSACAGRQSDWSCTRHYDTFIWTFLYSPALEDRKGEERSLLWSLLTGRGSVPAAISTLVMYVSRMETVVKTTGQYWMAWC